MLLCFSKRSPVVKKYKKRHHKMTRSWSPEVRVKDKYDKRWHDDEEYSRVGDEYRPKYRESDETTCWEEEGHRRSRTSKDHYKKVKTDEYATRSSRRHSYESDVEDKHLTSKNTTKALVHKDRIPVANETFRSSMLWKELDPTKLPKGNEVQPTFPPNRYSIVPDTSSKICPTPVTAAKKPKFRVNLDVSHYAPNEVIVQFEDGFLTAEGKHFAESDFGYETCEFFRKYPLPEGLDSSDISYKINNDGILVVTGGAVSESRKIHQNMLNDECKTLNALRNDKRYSSYDNIAKEVSKNLESVKRKKSIGFGEFQLVDGKCFVLLVNVDGFAPQDMKVKVIGKEIVVTGVKKIESNEGNEKRIIHKEFTKKFNVPENGDVESIVSRMTSDGNLKIECSKHD